MSSLFKTPKPPPIPDPTALPDTDMIDQNRRKALRRMRASSGILSTQLQNNGGASSTFTRSTLGSN